MATGRQWLKRIGCFIGVMIFLSAVLFGILVWIVYRQESSAPSQAVSAPKNFTASTIAAPTGITNASIATDDDPSIGPAGALVTIVEFSDFECPFCKQAFPIIRELMATYGDRVRYIYRDFPVSSIHDNAQKSAEAGACAHAQGKFWALHDKIFQNAPQITVPDLKNYARSSGLDMSLFTTCLDNGKFANEVQQDQSDGTALGVRGTPTWFFNGRKVEGVIPREVFMTLIETLLTTSSQK
ncbi:MAG: DsbA family protein [bacterium]|nr:DsbA family protein [bacterium]